MNVVPRLRFEVSRLRVAVTRRLIDLTMLRFFLRRMLCNDGSHIGVTSRLSLQATSILCDLMTSAFVMPLEAYETVFALQPRSVQLSNTT
jgi:hypothetical protein